MRVAIIDYGMGNLCNVQKAFAKLGVEASITDQPQEILTADAVVLPGVGAMKAAMKALGEKELVGVIKACIGRGTPFLGICLGMQLLFERGYEMGSCEGLGILPGEIVRLDVPLKVPHMGWNTLEIIKEAPLLEGIGEKPWMYFVHSYYLETRADIVSAFTMYGKRIAVAVQQNNVYGVQFHPEKSGEDGMLLLSNFLRKVGMKDAVISSD
ncbi:MAG: imidazole glycerol phosphate synthase subunit HisH [Cellulosilyticaceae bacterium]